MTNCIKEDMLLQKQRLPGTEIYYHIESSDGARKRILGGVSAVQVPIVSGFKEFERTVPISYCLKRQRKRSWIS